MEVELEVPDLHLNDFPSICLYIFTFPSHFSVKLVFRSARRLFEIPWFFSSHPDDVLGVVLQCFTTKSLQMYHVFAKKPPVSASL